MQTVVVSRDDAGNSNRLWKLLREEKEGATVLSALENKKGAFASLFRHVSLVPVLAPMLALKALSKHRDVS